MWLDRISKVMCQKVWLFSSPLDSVERGMLRQGTAWVHWPFQSPLFWQLSRSPETCYCSLWIGLNASSVPGEHLPCHPCAKPEDCCEEKGLPVSVLLKLVNKQNASKENVSKPEFWCKKKHLVSGAHILYHFSITHSPSFKKQKNSQINPVFEKTFSNVYYNVTALSQSWWL